MVLLHLHHLALLLCCLCSHHLLFFWPGKAAECSHHTCWRYWNILVNQTSESPSLDTHPSTSENTMNLSIDDHYALLNNMCLSSMEGKEIEVGELLSHVEALQRTWRIEGEDYPRCWILSACWETWHVKEESEPASDGNIQNRYCNVICMVLHSAFVS